MARMLLGVSDEERRSARNELCKLLDSPPTKQAPRHIICEILKEIGVPCCNLGHTYLMEAIMMVANDWKYINNITFGLYPQLAARFDTTASRVERAIRHSIEQGWTRGDLDILQKYFGNTVSDEKSKPTNGEFIAQLAQELKNRISQ